MITRAQMIHKIAWAEARASAHPPKLHQVIAESHIEILGTLPTEEIQAYYDAMFEEPTLSTHRGSTKDATGQESSDTRER